MTGGLCGRFYAPPKPADCLFCYQKAGHDGGCVFEPRRRTYIATCTGCYRRGEHRFWWLGTYCLRCRVRSIPRRWRTWLMAAWLDLTDR